MSQSREELLKAVSDVLEEALSTYEKLEKMETEVVQDPSKSSMSAAQPEEKDKKDKDDAEKIAKEDESAESPAEEKKEEKEDPKEDEKEKEATPEEEDKDEDDEKLMATYKSTVAKMEKRGLLKKNEEEVKKSETKVEDNKEIETLKKSFTDKFEELSKKIEEINSAVSKIAKTPAAQRRGLTGAQPLRKSEEAEGSKSSPSKGQVINQLLDLKKSGDRRVDTGLISRLETGRSTNTDMEQIQNILGL